MATEVRSYARRAELRDRGTGELVKDLSAQVTRLVRQEVELAKAETAEKGKKAAVGVGMFGGAGVAGLLMLGSLTACLILAFALAVSAWAAALIVAALWGVIAAVLALQGRARMREIGKPVPEKTVETLKEDVQWLKDRK
jgi:uncharacterized membrane protein YqjE